MNIVQLCLYCAAWQTHCVFVGGYTNFCKTPVAVFIWLLWQVYQTKTPPQTRARARFMKTNLQEAMRRNLYWKSSSSLRVAGFIYTTGNSRKSSEWKNYKSKIKKKNIETVHSAPERITAHTVHLNASQPTDCPHSWSCTWRGIKSSTGTSAENTLRCLSVFVRKWVFQFCWKEFRQQTKHMKEK